MSLPLLMGPRGFGSRDRSGALVQLFRSLPDQDPLSWISSNQYEPNVSNLTFSLVSEQFWFRDLNLPQSRPKIASVLGHAEMCQKRGYFVDHKYSNGSACPDETLLPLLRGPGASGAALVRGRGCNLSDNDLVTSPCLGQVLRTPCRGRATKLKPCFLFQLFV